MKDAILNISKSKKEKLANNDTELILLNNIDTQD